MILKKIKYFMAILGIAVNFNNTHAMNFENKYKQKIETVLHDQNKKNKFFELSLLLNPAIERKGSWYGIDLNEYYNSIIQHGFGNYYLWGTTQLAAILGSEEILLNSNYDFLKFARIVMNDKPIDANYPEGYEYINDDFSEEEKKDLKIRANLAIANFCAAREKYNERCKSGKYKYLCEYISHQAKHMENGLVQIVTPFGECNIEGGRALSYKEIGNIFSGLSQRDLKRIILIVYLYLKMPYQSSGNNLMNITRQHLKSVKPEDADVNLEVYASNLIKEIKTKYKSDGEKILENAKVLCGIAMVSEPLRYGDGGYTQRCVYNLMLKILSDNTSLSSLDDNIFTQIMQNSKLDEIIDTYDDEEVEKKVFKKLNNNNEYRTFLKKSLTKKGLIQKKGRIVTKKVMMKLTP